MKEYFTIHTGAIGYDEQIQEQVIEQSRERVALGFILIGAIFLLLGFIW